jgi:hypothetical protein
VAQAANSPQQKQLLEQVRLGESTQREDLVRQSLYRLELIDPNNPDVIAARFRYLLRQGDNAGAQKELDRLKGIARARALTSPHATPCCFPPGWPTAAPAGATARHYGAHAGSDCRL